MTSQALVETRTAQSPGRSQRASLFWPELERTPLPPVQISQAQSCVGALTIGIPGFFLALAPNRQLAHSGFVDRVLHFAVPAGLLGAAATFLAYYESRDMAQVSLAESKTAATIALVVYGLFLLGHISKALKMWRLLLVSVMGGGLVLAITVPQLSAFFKLDPPPLPLFALTIASVGVAFALMLTITRALRCRNLSVKRSARNMSTN